MKPSVGRIVIVRTEKDFNGSKEHPAIINRVWGTNDPAEAKGSFVCVNATVLPDCGAPFSMTSLALYETKEEADEASHNGSNVGWWPSRV